MGPQIPRINRVVLRLQSSIHCGHLRLLLADPSSFDYRAAPVPDLLLRQPPLGYSPTAVHGSSLNLNERSFALHGSFQHPLAVQGRLQSPRWVLAVAGSKRLFRNDPLTASDPQTTETDPAASK